MECSCSLGNASSPNGRRCLSRLLYTGRCNRACEYTVGICESFYLALLSHVYSSSILQDCDQPNEFIPERYMENPDLPDPRTVIFGFGRRYDVTLVSIVADTDASPRHF